jgi:hypothetical protein
MASTGTITPKRPTHRNGEPRVVEGVLADRPAKALPLLAAEVNA